MPPRGRHFRRLTNGVTDAKRSPFFIENKSLIFMRILFKYTPIDSPGAALFEIFWTKLDTCKRWIAKPFRISWKKTKDGASAPTVRRLVNLRPNASPNRFAQKTKNVLRLKSYRLVQVALTITQNWGLCIVWNAIELSFILKRKPLPFFKYYSNQPSKQETTCW